MSNHLMKKLAQAEGYCCEDNYFRDHDNLRSRDLARRLGVDKRTVNHHRRRIRCGDSRCDKTCLDGKRMFELLCIRVEKEYAVDKIHRRVSSRDSIKRLIEEEAMQRWIARYRERARDAHGVKLSYLEGLQAYRELVRHVGNNTP